MNETSNLDQNLLLRASPEGVRRRIADHLTLTEMKPGDVMYESGDLVNDVYFPASGIVSLLGPTVDGATAEISLVGNEGILGIELLMGEKNTLSRAIAQTAGQAYRLNGEYLEPEFQHDAEFHHLLLRYTQALVTQMARTAACNRHHSIEQHLCRWSLESMDRQRGNELTTTREMVANMLGVGREGVTAAASRLQQAEVIEYRRDHIRILNRPKLEELCCECYADTRREFDRLGIFA